MATSRYVERYGLSRKRIRQLKWKQQKGFCTICETYIPEGSVQSGRIDLDHHHPRALGGSDTLDNLRLTHKSCNSQKGSTHPGCEKCEMAQEQKNKQTAKKKNEEEEVQAKGVKNEELDESTEDVLDKIDEELAEEELSDDLDDVLGEIDDLLEENAQTFVSQFIQKGGE